MNGRGMKEFNLGLWILSWQIRVLNHENTRLRRGYGEASEKAKTRKRKKFTTRFARDARRR